MDVYGMITGVAIFIAGLLSGIAIVRYTIGLSLKIASAAMYGGQINEPVTTQEYTDIEEEV